MCRGTAEGKRRCPCDTSEKRRLRRKNQQAVQSITLDAQAPHRPSQALTVEYTVTPEHIHGQIEKVEALKAKASRPVPGGKQKILSQIEEETTRTGALFNKFLEQETGRSDQDIRDSWNSRKDHLAQQLKTADEEESLYLREQLKEMSTDQGQETRRIAKQRGEETLKHLQQFRSCGEGSFLTEETDSHVSHSHASVSRFFPSDWIDQARKNGTQLDFKLVQGAGGKYVDTIPGEKSTIEISADYAYGSQIEGEPYLQEYAQDNLNSLLLHETTHHMEYLAKQDDKNSLAQVQKTFLERRTTHDGVKEQPLSPDQLEQKLSSGMTVYADSFSNVYAGRTYAGNHSYEVLTVGAESVFTGKQGGLLGIGNCAPDPDHKNFVLGVWLTHRRT